MLTLAPARSRSPKHVRLHHRRPRLRRIRRTRPSPPDLPVHVRLAHHRLLPDRLLDLERRGMELHHGRPRLRGRYPRTHLFRERRARHRALLGQEARVRDGEVGLQAAQHVLCRTRDRVPLARLVRVQRRVRVVEQLEGGHGPRRHPDVSLDRWIGVDVDGLEARTQVFGRRVLFGGDRWVGWDHPCCGIRRGRLGRCVSSRLLLVSSSIAC